MEAELSKFNFLSHFLLISHTRDSLCCKPTCCNLLVSFTGISPAAAWCAAADRENLEQERFPLYFHALLMRRNERKVNHASGSSACVSPVWLQGLVLSFLDGHVCPQQSKNLIKLRKFSFRDSFSLLFWRESSAERGGFKSQLAGSCTDFLELVVLRRLLPVFRCVCRDVTLAVSFRSQLLTARL